MKSLGHDGWNVLETLVIDCFESLEVVFEGIDRAALEELDESSTAFIGVDPVRGEELDNSLESEGQGLNVEVLDVAPTELGVQTLAHHDQGVLFSSTDVIEEMPQCNRSVAAIFSFLEHDGFESGTGCCVRDGIVDTI